MAYISHKLGLYRLHHSSSDSSGDISNLRAGTAFRETAKSEGKNSKSLPRLLGSVYHSDPFGLWHHLHVLGGYI